MQNRKHSLGATVLFAFMTVLVFSCIIAQDTESGMTVIVVTSTPDDSGGGGGSSDATPTFTVVHVMRPSDFSGTTRYITDPESRDYAPQLRANPGADVFAENRYERPFTETAMDYLTDVDLKRMEMKIAAPWVYITFEFEGGRTEGIGETMYGAEFDTDKDGRGDWLIWGASPAGTDWTTDGVEVWKDSNEDVGGARPQEDDAPNPSADGYDEQVFSGGQGADPDLAWIRQAAGGGKVQLAFKYSAIGNAPQFLWNGLADAGLRNPGWFDYNDHFTAAEAGSPNTYDGDRYPLKGLYGIDNTCRDAYGFDPTGDEPGLCGYPARISGKVFYDGDGSGTQNEPDDIGMPGWQVTLGSGACPSSGLQTATTDGNGDYAFADIIQGE
jgi:hypothetical protein